MSDLAIRKTVTGDLEEVASRVEEALKMAGFGVLTRIDFDQKIREKLGHEIPRTLILGACNPRLAYEAYQHTKDVALLIPCNVVVRAANEGSVAVEAIRPSRMLAFLPDLEQKIESVKSAESALEEALASL